MKVIYIFLTFNQNQIKEDGTVFLDQASMLCNLLATAGITQYEVTGGCHFYV